MHSLEKTIIKSVNKKVASEPLFFDTSRRDNCTELEKLFKAGRIHQVRDDYVEQMRELFAIKNPTLVYKSDFEDKFKIFLGKVEKETPLFRQGRWVFFPWLSTLVHVLGNKDFQLVRTARNRYLISPKEQDIFYKSVVGIGGLSVGNSVALAVVLQGGAGHIRLADFDRLALSNINRIRAGVQNLGLSKVEMTARQIYEINPYARVEIWKDGLTPDNIDKFFKGPPKLDIVVDELDNIAVKFLIRKYAKKHRLAVVMAADNGDNAVVDIERYDLEPQPNFFHGRLGKVSYEQLKNLDKFGIGQTITKHIGPENITERMQQSLLEMGKTIVSWPQLGGAALLNGSAVAYCVRKILNKEPVESNRALISLDEKLIPGYNSTQEVRKRKKIADNFKKMFKL